MMEADYQRMEILRLKETIDSKDAEIQKLRGFCSKYKRENQSLKQRIVSCEQEEEENALAMERLMEQKIEDRRVIQSQKKAMKHVRGIIDNPSPSVASLRSRFDQENAQPTAPMQTPPPPYQTPGRPPGGFRKRLEATTSTSGVNGVSSGGQGYVNPKYQRRSKSASRLLDHQPLHRVPTGTVLQSRTPANAIRTTKPEVYW